jgi:AAA15 family ATPase/GTPase
MIENISIENFRCFDKTEIKGFERINLITGKNNSGKTCLLEALYFGLSEDWEGTIDTRRNEDDKRDSKSLLYDEKKMFLNLSFKRWNEEYGFKFIPQSSFENRNSSGIDNVVQLIFNEDKKYPNSFNLVKLFDEAQIGGYSDKILEAINIIDSTISKIRTFASFPNTLFLRTNSSSKYQSVNNYGDAIKKIMLYVGIILNYKNEPYKYLLIDEIENGIHYTAQKEVWQMLFKLCQHFDIQLFATTHSREMIIAFEEVCEEFEGEGAYFEMARHAKTNQIIGIKHEIATLEYELETNTAIRGE